jgi:hypothetical protein
MILFLFSWVHLWGDTIVAPPNLLKIDTLIPAYGNSIKAKWSWQSAEIPNTILFLYKPYQASEDTPQSYLDTITFHSQRYQPSLDTGTTSIFGWILPSTRYIVAAYIQDKNGNWSSVSVWDTLTVDCGCDTAPPSGLDINVYIDSITSNSVRLNWQITPDSLAKLLLQENGKLSLVYDYNKYGFSIFDTLVSYAYSTPPTATGNIVITNLNASCKYYFAVSLRDSAYNTAIPKSLSRDSATTLSTRLEYAGIRPQTIAFSILQNPTTSSFAVIAYNLNGKPKGLFQAYDIQGRLMFSSEVNGNGVLNWQFSNNTNSIFICQMRTLNESVAKKVVFVK